MNRGPLRSPVSGESLAADTPHSLADAAGQRWPVVDGIPYLRIGRDALVEKVLGCLDRGDRDGALVELLADQDDWWAGPRPAGDDLRRLVRDRDSLNLRAAMTLLAFGRVGDYFAHRWSDPTFLAGLALLEAHWQPIGSAFELACGIGHFGREFLRRGYGYAGADVVFSKLWLARWWVLGDSARLVCFDAARPWPVADERFDLALCQDAFYFLEPKPVVLGALRKLVSPGGWIAVGHIHNREATNFSAGAAVSAAELSALFPDGVAYDDAELTWALVESRAPKPRPVQALRDVEAFSVAAGPGLVPIPRPLTGGLAMPPVDHGPLRSNPLYQRGCTQNPHPEQPSKKACRRTGVSGPAAAPSSFDTGLSAPAQEEGAWEIAWPSERYQSEYAARATYPARFCDPRTPETLTAAIRCRALVDLPERW